MGDGEQGEGSIYEAAMAARQYRLDNLVAIICLLYTSMQADSTAGFFRSLLHLINTFEDMFLVFVYDTLSVVCHTDACIVIFAIKMYIDFSFIRSVFEDVYKRQALNDISSKFLFTV